MSYTADQIEVIVQELTDLKSKYTIEQINEMEKYNAFKTQNRTFYEMITSPDGVDPHIFKEMIRMKRRLENGEDQYSVDVRFGSYMAQKYIDPVVKK
jgi:hypothetical protein